MAFSYAGDRLVAYCRTVRSDLGETGVADGFAERYNAAAAASYGSVSKVVFDIIVVSMPTLASQSRRLVPSAPDQNRERMTIDCAMIS
jgi:hypothetical protein